MVIYTSPNLVKIEHLYRKTLCVHIRFILYNLIIISFKREKTNAASDSKRKKERHGPPLMQKAHNVKRDTQFK